MKSDREILPEAPLEERLSLVPEKAYHPSSPEGLEYWGMVAEGSVVLDRDVFDAICAKIKAVQDEQKKD